MLLGLIVYVFGQKYLEGVGDLVVPEVVENKRGVKKEKPLTKIEKDSKTHVSLKLTATFLYFSSKSVHSVSIFISVG